MSCYSVQSLYHPSMVYKEKQKFRHVKHPSNCKEKKKERNLNMLTTQVVVKKKRNLNMLSIKVKKNIYLDILNGKEKHKFRRAHHPSFGKENLKFSHVHHSSIGK